MTEDEVRAVALALPEAVELPHHGFPSFRVNKRVFATMPQPGRLNVMLEPDVIREAVAVAPECCVEVWWGRTLSAVGVDLGAVAPDALADLLAQAWRRRAPKRLLKGPTAT